MDKTELANLCMVTSLAVFYDALRCSCVDNNPMDNFATDFLVQARDAVVRSGEDKSGLQDLMHFYMERAFTEGLAALQADIQAMPADYTVTGEVLTTDELIAFLHDADYVMHNVGRELCLEEDEQKHDEKLSAVSLVTGHVWYTVQTGRDNRFIQPLKRLRYKLEMINRWAEQATASMTNAIQA